MRELVVYCSVCAITAGLAVLAIKGSTAWAAVLFLAPFSLGPLLITLILAFFCERAVSLALLLASTCLYSAWFAYVYLDAFYWHVDPQSAIAMVVVGIYSLPVMLPLWSVAYRMRKLPVDSTTFSKS
jgi:hypothetical protein